MSEVSSWSETDASNNLTPPDGWPEGMQPSGVNNVGRMMMGSIKRWYNTVTAGIANALPLSGGTLTGPLTATSLISTGNVVATLDVGAGRNLWVSGNAGITGGLTASEIHSTDDLSVDNDLTAGTVTAGYIHSTGDAGITGGLTASEIHSTDDLAVDHDLTAGTVTAGYIHSTGALDVAGLLTTQDLHTNLQTVNTTLVVNGTTTVNALTAASVTSPYIHSTGGLDVNGTLNASAIGSANEVTATNYQLSGNPFAARASDGAGTLNAIFDGAGGVAFAAYGPNGSYYRCDNAHAFTNRAASLNICRFQATDGNCINASGLWNSVSDRAVKDDIAPYHAGLDAALRLEPVSFRYAADAPFGAGELHYGLVAQDVEPILPEMCRRAEIGDTDYLTIAPGHLVFVLLNAVKELEARLAQLEGR